MVEKKKKVLYISVDCEVDGPAPGIRNRGSMFWFGAVVVEPGLKNTFDGKIRPISKYFEEERLAISGVTRAETMRFPKPHIVMPLFVKWILAAAGDRRPVLISDNNGFDFGVMNNYLWRYTGGNPFGHTSRNLNDLYKGHQHNIYSSFKHLVVTPHNHLPVDDATGHAEAFMAFAPELKIKF